MPGRGSIRWTANQVQRLKKAIAAYNGAVTRMEKSGKYEVVPQKTSFDQEVLLLMGLSRNELYKREKALGRILKKNNKRAADVVEYNGKTMPRYLKQEASYTKRSINYQRDKLKRTIYPEWDDMSKPEQLTALSGRNLHPDTREPGEIALDLDAATRDRYASDFIYMDRYLEVLYEVNGEGWPYGNVSAIIKELVANHPDHIRKLMEAKSNPELELEYLYPEGRSSAFMQSFNERMWNVNDFWERQLELAEAEPSMTGWNKGRLMWKDDLVAEGGTFFWNN